MVIQKIRNAFLGKNSSNETLQKLVDSYIITSDKVNPVFETGHNINNAYLFVLNFENEEFGRHVSLVYHSKEKDANVERIFSSPSIVNLVFEEIEWKDAELRRFCDGNEPIIELYRPDSISKNVLYTGTSFEIAGKTVKPGTNFNVRSLNKRQIKTFNEQIQIYSNTKDFNVRPYK